MYMYVYVYVRICTTLMHIYMYMYVRLFDKIKNGEVWKEVLNNMKGTKVLTLGAGR